MSNLTINDFLTSKEASEIYGQHERTINRNISKNFTEGVDYRKLNGRTQLLITKACLETYYADPNKYRANPVFAEKVPIPDRYYRI